MTAPRSTQLDPNTLEKFVDPLPVPPVAIPAGTRPSPHYRIAMRQISAKLHRDLPATRMWAFGDSVPGPTIETRSGEGLRVEWINNLPDRHCFPVDHNLHGAGRDKPEVRAVVHVHGAKAPPESDGYPEDWYVPGKSSTYYYPNRQEAALLWYHDHAMGINRLNIYAGLFGLFIVRDAAEDALGLPRGRYEVPLVFCDRFLTRDGQLDYPDSGIPGAPWVPEVFGDAMVLNGKLFPYLEVEPCKYRFRLLNAANGRFFHLSLSNGQSFHAIATDQGLLSAPVEMKNIQMAPGERVDLVVDFGGHAGEWIILNNDSFTMMQFRVGVTPVADGSRLPAVLRPVRKIAERESVRTRELPIYEYMNDAGGSALMLLSARHWDMPITENPAIGTTEIWSIVNLTEDTHPIHLHLVRFQILDRRPFDAFEYQLSQRIRYTGDPIASEPFEAGWKDTVRANPLSVTRIIARFEGFTGRYVWHCHVLEHEDNEMMRPYEVIARPS